MAIDTLHRRNVVIEKEKESKNLIDTLTILNILNEGECIKVLEKDILFLSDNKKI